MVEFHNKTKEGNLWADFQFYFSEKYHTSSIEHLEAIELCGSEEKAFDLFFEETGEQPVLLLDDVLSELDPGRQDFVLNQIVSGQVFITCCEPGRFTKLGKTIEICNGNVK